MPTTLPPADPATSSSVHAGQRHQALRKQRRSAQLGTLPPPPGPAEMAELWHMMAERQALAAAGVLGAAASATTPRATSLQGVVAGVPIRETVLSTAQLMHAQDRNTAGTIFGGHLLRSAFEVAFACAALHAERSCHALGMNDVSFHTPVPIGSLLKLQVKLACGVPFVGC